MRIVVDQDLHLQQLEIPADWELVKREGRLINSEDVRDADALLIRSVTRVNEALLHNSRVRFVGTATSGLDHIDRAYLAANTIRLADAAGANANAVSDYCLAALAFGVLQRELDIAEARIAIVGAGHVGGLLANKLRRLGLHVLVCDPPLQQSGAPGEFSSLAEAATCDVVSLHVPLQESGEHATREFIDADILSAMPGTGMLINSCRGEVIDELALQAHLRDNEKFTAVLDVWQNEPRVNPETMALAHIATPHIAGYSARAKDEAAARIVDALKTFSGSATGPADAARAGSGDRDTGAVVPDPGNRQGWKTVLQHFDLPALSRAFRQAYRSGIEKQAFDAMRRQLASRREFCETRVVEVSEETAGFLGALGFKLES